MYLLSRGGGCIYTCLVRVSFTSLAGEGIGFIPAFFFLVICTSLLRECFLLYLCSGSVINTCLGGVIAWICGSTPILNLFSGERCYWNLFGGHLFEFVGVPLYCTY